ncbi:MAG: hypothetical protein HND58_02995 [Planctomycetota bacterium]|nr:MAG: hypothetical protein HND58_02995 [Planctomycetota bacterium]
MARPRPCGTSRSTRSAPSTAPPVGTQPPARAHLATTHPDPHPDLATALAGLPRRQREVAYLRHVAGLTVDQTAAALGVPRGTIASRNHAAMQRLRDILSPTAPHRDAAPDPPAANRHASREPNPAAEPTGAPRHAITG